jgi:hypothetical protein
VSNPQHLHLALKALAPAGRTFYDDQAPGDATAPWLVGSLLVPESKVSLAATRHGSTAIFRVTVAAETGAQARVIAQEAEDAWTGVRMVVPGWTLGAVRPPRVRGPYAAGLTATDTNLRFQVVVLEFDLTASRVPIPV